MIIRSLMIFIVIAINPSSSVHYKWADNTGNTYEINIQDSSKPKYTPPLTYSNQNRNNFLRFNLRFPLIQFSTQQQRFQQRYPQQQNQPQQYPQQQNPQQQNLPQQYPQQQNPQQQNLPQQYPEQQNPQQQNQQQYVGFHNPQYPQQQTPGIALPSAEWVCTNQKTNEVIFITSDDIPSKFNGREISYINNTFVPNVSRAPQAWTDNSQTEEEPTTTTTTEKPIWSNVFSEPEHVNPSWLNNDKNSQPGLIVIEPTTTSPPPKTTQAPDDDNSDDDDDDGPIQIDFGK